MRARVTAVAGAGTFVALLLAAVALHVVLDRSLTSQIDDVLTNRALDVADNIDVYDALDDTSFPGDGLTFIGVIEPSTDGLSELLLEVHNDDSPDVAEVYEVISSPAFTFAEPVDASLPSLDLIEGDTNMRFVAVPVETGDEIVVVARSLDGIDRTIRQVDTFSLFSVPLLATVVGGLVWLLTGRALGPVETMRRQVESISQTANLDQRVAATGQANELDRLGATMNSMLERLAAGQERERQFASDAAHELRSPLASMAAQLDVDAAHPETADHRHTAELLQRETARLRHLVDDLLLLDRSGADTESGHRLLDLDDLLRVATSSVPAVPAVVLQLPSFAAAQVRGNQVELERLLTNVISNGLRHATSRVAVTLDDQGDTIVVTIDDDGAGIPEVDRERVFERFTRLDEARSRDRGGVGLGLALARDIAHRHRGTLVVEQSPLGGARFTLRLPSP